MPPSAFTSGDDYLKKLFAQTAPQPISAAGPCTVLERDPAFAARSLPALLSKLDLGFLIPYVRHGVTSRTFDNIFNRDWLSYDYECPDLQTKTDEDPRGLVLQETFEIELNLRNLSAGLIIAFNDNTGLYQLDLAFVQTDQEEYADLSCGKRQAGELKLFLVTFSSLAQKLVKQNPIYVVEQSVLTGFTARRNRPVPGIEPS